MFEYKLFNQLPTWSQVEVLTKTGTIVAQRNHNGWTITLYSLDNYFVELWIKQDLEVVGSFHRSADPMEILEPYMQHIRLSDLYN